MAIVNSFRVLGSSPLAILAVCSLALASLALVGSACKPKNDNGDDDDDDDTTSEESSTSMDDESETEESQSETKNDSSATDEQSSEDSHSSQDEESDSEETATSSTEDSTSDTASEESSSQEESSSSDASDDTTTSNPAKCEDKVTDDSVSFKEGCIIWQRKNNEKLPWREFQPGIVTAPKTCEDLEFLGLNDWRLPTLAELKSIIKTGVWPTIDSELFPDTPTAMWSSEASDGTHVKVIDYSNGQEGNYGGDGPQNFRCVHDSK